MTNFAIMRHEKITSKAKLAMAIGHNRRTIPVPNAKEGVKNAYTGLSDPLAAFDKRLDQLGIKPRANAVLAYEMLFTYSPDMKGIINNAEFLRLTKEFLKKEFPSNAILSVDMHYDEQTPHIHAIVMPIIEKTVRGKNQWRLSARDYTGTPDMLKARQTRFAEFMAELGLVRGTENSKATHKEIKAFYGALKTDLQIINDTVDELVKEIPKKQSFFNKAVYSEKINALLNQFKLIFQKVANAEKDNQLLTKQLQQANQRIKKLKNDAVTSEVLSIEKIKELVRQGEKQHQEEMTSKYSPDKSVAPAKILETTNKNESIERFKARVKQATPDPTPDPDDSLRI